MNDIIKMAREAGLGPTTVNVWLAYLARFAALVRADEREQCAVAGAAAAMAGQDYTGVAAAIRARSDT